MEKNKRDLNNPNIDFDALKKNILNQESVKNRTKYQIKTS